MCGNERVELKHLSEDENFEWDTCLLIAGMLTAMLIAREKSGFPGLPMSEENVNVIDVSSFHQRSIKYSPELRFIDPPMI